MAFHPRPRDQMPDVATPDPPSREAVPQEGRYKDDGPLKSLRLVDRHDPDGVWVRVLVVLPPFRISLLGLELKEVSEALVLVLWLGVIVDGLEVGNQLT